MVCLLLDLFYDEYALFCCCYDQQGRPVLYSSPDHDCNHSVWSHPLERGKRFINSGSSVIVSSEDFWYLTRGFSKDLL